MHVARVRGVSAGKPHESVLVRQSYRVGSQVKHRTLASLTKLPPALIDLIERALRGEQLVPVDEALTIERSRPHGHAAAVLGTARKLGLEAVLDPQPSRQRDLMLALVVARVLQPASKLATARLWSTTSLGPLLGVDEASDDEVYAAMDWLLARQDAIERRLAKRHLEPGGGAV
jgi:hypothetical protein